MRSLRFILLPIIVSIVLCTPLSAQRHNNAWYFGWLAGLDFNDTIPRALNGGQMRAPEGSASVADPRTGTPLMYTNGDRIWNREHTVMPNGDSLQGHSSSLQSSVIVPDPASEFRYYVFTTDARERGYRGGLRYSLVDMREDSGRGDVIRRDVPVVAEAGETLCAVRSCNDNGFWVITHWASAPGFFAVSVTVDGVSAPVFSDVGLPDFGIGEIKASHDGEIIVTSTMLGVNWDSPAGTRFLRLDHATGRLSHIATIPGDIGWFCFSPDDSKLYHNNGQLLQYDVTLLDSAAIAASKVVIFDRSIHQLRGLQLAPDGKIYVAPRYASYLGVIENPNAAGLACGFRLDGPNLGAGICLAQLPNVVSGLNTLAVDAGANVSICAGDSVALRGSGARLLRWSPSESITCADCAEPIAHPKTTTTYRLIGSNANGCTDTDSVTVTVYPLPLADAGHDTVICRGSDVALRADGGIQYQWSPTTGLSCADCADPIARVEESTTYRVRVTNDGGCSSEDSIRVTLAELPVADAGRDTNVCSGTPARLEASSGVAWQWSPSIGLSCADCRSPLASPSATTTYRLDVWNAAGCMASDDVVVFVDERPTLVVTADTTICDGASVELLVVGAIELVWDASTDLSCLECASPIARPTKTTTYFVTGANKAGCSARDSVTIAIRPQPVLTMLGDTAICVGSSAQLAVRGAETYRWWTASGELACATCDEQTVLPDATTTYYVEGHRDGCAAIDSFTVTVMDRPEISVSGGGELCRGSQLQLDASGATSYVWEPTDGLSCTDCSSPIANPIATTTYRVIGMLAGGCSDTATTTVTVVEPSRVLAKIERNARLLPGESTTLHVSIDHALVTDSVSFDISWNKSVVLISSVELTPALASDGWAIESTNDGNGHQVSTITRSTAALIQPGPVVQFNVTAFIGDSMATEIPLYMRVAASSCASVESRAGQVMIDSICGLSFRLIEASDALLKLDAPVPHPISTTSEIRFSIPFDNQIVLELLDARGGSHALVNGHVPAGQHAIVFDARDLSSGIYHLRLRFGTLVRQVAFSVLK